MTTRRLLSGGVPALVVVLGAPAAFAQGDGPRMHWKELLTDTTLISLTHMSASGNTNPLDPSLTIQPGADFDLDVLLAG